MRLVQAVASAGGKEVWAALEGKDATVREALAATLKPKLNALQNHAYAMGHSTMLDEIGPPRQ